MLCPILLVPAYGKTYATKEALLAAWNNGKDFHDYRGPGRYCSIRDLKSLTYLTSSIMLTDPQSRVSVTVWQFCS
jgi:hypothetical protein